MLSELKSNEVEAAFGALLAFCIYIFGLIFLLIVVFSVLRTPHNTADIINSEPDAYLISEDSEMPVISTEKYPRWQYTELVMTNCAWCGKTFDLNRHHIIPQSFRTDMRNDITNLVVLCRTCHLCIGHRGNWKQYNPDVLEIVRKYTNVVYKTSSE